MMDVLVLAEIHDSWTHLNKILGLAKEMDGLIFLGDLMKFRKFTQESTASWEMRTEICKL